MIAPLDPRTPGVAMTFTNYRSYMAGMTQNIRTQLKAAHPNIVILHNTYVHFALTVSSLFVHGAVNGMEETVQVVIAISM